MRWLLALLSLGCARNAFLELSVEIPKNDRTAQIGDRYALIRVVTADTPFEQEWEGDNPIPPVKLSDAATTLQRISVEAMADSETKPVRVKVRFCKSPTCTDVAARDDRAPEAWLEIERAFYIGERTRLTWSIACIPNAPDVTPAPPTCAVANKTKIAIEKCRVEGCRSGQTSSYCVGTTHFCEQ